MITLANDSTFELMQAIALIEQKAERETTKAMLRSMFARHYRAVAKHSIGKGDKSKAAKQYARARKLEARVIDMANDLIY